MGATQSELRLARLIDERELVRNKHESKLAEVEARDDKTLTDSDSGLVKAYRENAANLDIEINDLAAELKAANDAIEESKALRRALAGNTDGISVDGDGVVYRDFATYARDVILTRTSQECSKIVQIAGGEPVARAARERLQLVKRDLDPTLSADVQGLQPAQHIAQIFQVIDSSRPLVASALRSTLERGQLTYPVVVQRPEVAVQNTQKTAAGDQGMVVDMVNANASTYLGGGNLSWQAINWSTPDALSLWFQLAAADYALKTEQDAAQALQHSGFSNNISALLDGTDTYDDWVAAIVEGCGDVYANSGRLADTLYLAPDQFFAFAGAIPETVASAFLAGGVSLAGLGGSFAGLRIIVSRGMDAGVGVVGDSQGLLVAETAGAPVELRVVEPAIGGVEVGIIGAFEAAVVDDGAFAMITTAS